MRDGITLVNLGKPVVVVVQATFEKAAHVHAAGLGCPDLPIVAYRHPPPGSDAGPEIMGALALDIRRQSVEQITRGKSA